MGPELLHYTIYFFLTLGLSTLFSMGGVGSAIGLVPIFSMMDMSLNLAKAIGLFINSASTITASIMNFFRGVLDIKFAIPLIVSIMIATPLGAYASQYVNKEIVEWILVAFIVISAFLLLFSNREQKVVYDKAWILYVIGGSVGLISGTIGVGGGSLIMPLLILLGFDAKKAAYAISFVIPFSTLGAFATYLSFVDMDWMLLGVVTVAAIIGGYLGDRIMHYRLTPSQVKKLIAVVLLLLAAKMIYKLIGA
ncbi:sulfite exporter TauE/SafE family protein [Sulfurimonas paralvinellae]|uniref:Probable membrane transporter protein n=1 Tax=Sulfurimonas paralvinellae TaxID=317658 RepID=A0A7M1BAM7_9BACT|nr:sulfite exporter TauE/SafE family protein [Sulfurimonas paralvinellae]QOP45812.1 sulfite exporter TauE/SafE family protein [Sulfurimonas paralvinellae]